MAEDEMTYVRVLPAERDVVFACMTEPEHLTAFWGPQDMTTPLDGIVVELRPGGRFETLMVNLVDGTTHLMRARFDQVQPPSLLSWTDLDSGMTVTATFRGDEPGRTEVTIVQRRMPEAARTPEARAGFASSLDRFHTYLLDLEGKDH